MNTTRREILVLSNISRDIAQVFFGGLLIGPIASNSLNLPLVLSGSIFSVICWLLSIKLIKYN